MDEGIQQDQVAGGGNGKPLGDALHDAEEYCFQNFDKNHKIAPFHAFPGGKALPLSYSKRGYKARKNWSFTFWGETL